jgi:hypothetical protein
MKKFDVKDDNRMENKVEKQGPEHSSKNSLMAN